MTITYRFMLAMAALACSVAIGSALLGGYTSSHLSEQALSTRANQQLLSLQASKANEMKHYFYFIEQQLLSKASLVHTQTALQAFTQAFAAVPPATMQQKKAVERFYQQDFSQQYLAVNPGATPDLQGKLSQLSPSAMSLQAKYLAENPYPLGDKDKLLPEQVETLYDQVHALYHPGFNQFLHAFGYYDLFLVDPAGNLVYSVYKELDFATNLFNGSYQTTGLGQAAARAMRAGNQQTVFEDFAPYFPSYQAPASFIATPIYHNNTLLGALVFQMPVDGINDVLTFSQQWQHAGLGETGQVVLIGPDGTMRSNDRQFLQQPEHFFQQLQLNHKTDIAQRVQQTGTTIGVLPISGKAVTLALAGQDGIVTEHHYQHGTSLRAYRAIDVFGQHWALIAEISQQEALQDLPVLKHAYAKRSAIFLLLVVLLAVALGWVFAKSLVKPLRLAIEQIDQMCQQRALDVILPAQGNDELAQLARALNTMFGLFATTLADFDQTATDLQQQAKQITSGINSTHESVAEQTDKTNQVVSAASQMTASINAVAESARLASAETEQAQQLGAEAKAISHALKQDMSVIQHEIAHACRPVKCCNSEVIPSTRYWMSLNPFQNK
ncbi:MAG: methyl-accepting chemotaxis protein [Alkalimonas sp.]|nr:methyl-accepting chemotaxis protein [Alkalimonas sp.]